MKFSVTVLGSSSASPTKNRFPTAHVLNVRERFFLIDCGEGTQHQLMRNGIGLQRINHIFISHLHGDHIFGLFGLLSTMNLDGRQQELHIYAFSQLEYILNDFLKYFGDNFTYDIVFHDINVKRHAQIYEDRAMTVETIPLKHSIPCCGFLFREKTPELNIRKEMIEQYSLSLTEIVKIKNGCDLRTEKGKIIPNAELTYLPYTPRSYAFCSDTKFDPKIAEIVKNVDLLYHEATYTDDMEKQASKWKHSTARQAAQIAKLAGAKKLIIGHFSARYKTLDTMLSEAQSEFKNTELAEDNKTFEIKLEKNNI